MSVARSKKRLVNLMTDLILDWRHETCQASSDAVRRLVDGGFRWSHDPLACGRRIDGLADGEAAMLGAMSRHWGWGTVMQVDNATDGKGASVGLPTLAPPPDLLLPAQTKARRP